MKTDKKFGEYLDAGSRRRIATQDRDAR